MSKGKNVTELLDRMRSGDQAAMNQLYDSIYPHLQKLARARRREWSGDYTMSSTALINEAYMKLANAADTDWQDRVHFFRVASRAMRQVLLNYGEKKGTVKRFGINVEFDDSKAAALASAEYYARIEETLSELEKKDPRLVDVFHARRIAGLSIAETAAKLGLSESTVKRDSKFIDAWIKDALKNSGSDEN